MTEAVKAIVKRGIEDLVLSALWINLYDGNVRSRRVAEKCGFTYHHTQKEQLDANNSTTGTKMYF